MSSTDEEVRQPPEEFDCEVCGKHVQGGPNSQLIHIQSEDGKWHGFCQQECMLDYVKEHDRQ